jgi:hypothetical protein
MQAWLSLPFADGPFDEHLIINGAPMAAIAAVCKNFRRDDENVLSVIT